MGSRLGLAAHGEEPQCRQPPMDWGRGKYERVAAALLPAAEAVLRAGSVLPGQRVLDVGCGTGNVG
jgi:2-polyprenyl-3-methyl-5-hydroxy-6-metoxy-1,4-benzoquinol methylase